MKYKVLKEGTSEALAEAVNKHIADGWLPQGGVALGLIPPPEEHTYLDPEFFYAQAMIRTEDESEAG